MPELRQHTEVLTLTILGVLTTNIANPDPVAMHVRVAYARMHE